MVGDLPLRVLGEFKEILHAMHSAYSRVSIRG